jgi:hypothetical protein
MTLLAFIERQAWGCLVMAYFVRWTFKISMPLHLGVRLLGILLTEIWSFAQVSASYSQDCITASCAQDCHSASCLLDCLSALCSQDCLLYIHTRLSLCFMFTRLFVYFMFTRLSLCFIFTRLFVCFMFTRLSALCSQDCLSVLCAQECLSPSHGQDCLCTWHSLLGQQMTTFMSGESSWGALRKPDLHWVGDKLALTWSWSACGYSTDGKLNNPR